MNKFTLKKVLFFIMLALITTSMMGQGSKKSSRNKFKSHWFIGAELGGTVLYGDNKMHQFDKMGFNGSVNVGYAFAKHFTVYGKAGLGTLNGELKNDFKIDQSNYISYDLNLSADLVSLFGGYNKKRVFGLLIHAGIGGLQYKSSSTTIDGVVYRYGYNDSEKGMKGNGIDGRKVALDVPMGLMFKFRVSNNVDLYADFALTYADTDALDALQRGKHKDWIATGNIGFRYKFLKAEEKKPAKVKTPNTVSQQPSQDVLEQQRIQDSIQKAAAKAAEEEAAAKAAQEAAAANKETRSTLDVVFGFSRNDAEISDEITGKSVLDYINSLGNVEIETIDVISYASPEGKDEFNNNISVERSDAVKNYLTNALGDKINGAKYNVTNVGADWDNFIRVLKDSKIESKENIINKLNSSSYKAGTLWALSTNHPEIADLYPELRRVEVKISIVQK